MKKLALFLLLFGALGCSNQKKIKETSALEAAPGWVNSKPIAPSYYTGIGVAQKVTGTNYQQQAKSNALSDMASEIKVNVSSNSLLSSLEQNNKFSQEFRETIQLNSSIKLEEFELVDSWEDEKSYWIYYRMSKAAYIQRRQRQKKEAQDLALNLYAQGETSSSRGNFQEAADHYLRGLQALESFWNESNLITYENREIALDNALYESLYSLLNSNKITLEKPLELNFGNKFQTNSTLIARRMNGDTPLVNTSLTVSYFGKYGRIKTRAKTNADGLATITIADTDLEKPQNSLEISVDVETIFAPYMSDPFMAQITEKLKGSSFVFPVVVTLPKIYLETSETNLGSPLSTKQITEAIRSSLLRRNYEIVANKNQADALLRLDAASRRDAISQGLYSALLQIDVALLDAKTGQTIYSAPANTVKGIDLSYEKAGMKAYQNTIKNIESEIIRSLVKYL